MEKDNGPTQALLWIIAVCALVMAGFITREDVERGVLVFAIIIGAFFVIASLLGLQMRRERRQRERELRAEAANPGIHLRRAGREEIAFGVIVLLLGTGFAGSGVAVLGGAVHSPNPTGTGWISVAAGGACLLWGLHLVRRGRAMWAEGKAKRRRASV